jgi:uncharacterized protein (TIGR02001 family)
MLAQPWRGQLEPVPVPAPCATRNCSIRERAFVSAALGIALLSIAGSVFAQFSGTISVVSDYRYRGISLSDSKPAAQLGVAYDDAQGWYAGTFVSTVTSDVYGTRGVQSISFAGYSWRMSSRLSFEAGADYSVITASPRYDYSEIYAGFAFQNVSGRLYYSPRYFGQSSPALYGELNLAQPLFENVRVLVHVGTLASNANQRYGYHSGPLFDYAAGLGVDWEGFRAQLSWVGVNHSSGAYAIIGTDRRSGAVVSLSHSF